jgi:hypothetical protein
MKRHLQAVDAQHLPDGHITITLGPESDGDVEAGDPLRLEVRLVDIPEDADVVVMTPSKGCG